MNGIELKVVYGIKLTLLLAWIHNETITTLTMRAQDPAILDTMNA
jgi:hypothetical protein